jgi:hypothetical protein
MVMLFLMTSLLKLLRMKRNNTLELHRVNYKKQFSINNWLIKSINQPKPKLNSNINSNEMKT